MTASVTSRAPDIVIVGGAVMGSSVACHLAEKIGGERILVIEKDPTYAKAASALSGSSIRQQYSTAVNVKVSLYGVAFIREIGEYLNIGDERPEIGLKEGGYLYLADETGTAILKENLQLQTALGADIVYFDQAGLKKQFPWLKVEDLAGGSWGRTGEGWFDGYGLMQAFRRKARAAGVSYLTAEVTDVEMQGSRAAAVLLSDGTRVPCGTLVNAAGAAGNRRVAGMTGISIPVWGKKRCIFQFTCRERLGGFPLLIDKSGVWARPEGEGFIGGFSPDDLVPTDESSDFEVNWPEFEDVVWPTLAERIPAFESIRPGAAWAGHYDMNLFDHNAIVGKLGDRENVYIAAGFSGHGLQQSPAVGRGLAELIVEGRFTTLDLSDFAFERIAAGRPLLERNVI